MEPDDKRVPDVGKLACSKVLVRVLGSKQVPEQVPGSIPVLELVQDSKVLEPEQVLGSKQVPERERGSKEQVQVQGSKELVPELGSKVLEPEQVLGSKVLELVVGKPDHKQASCSNA